MTQMEEELHAAVEEKDLFRQKSIQLEARAELAEEHAKVLIRTIPPHFFIFQNFF